MRTEMIQRRRWKDRRAMNEQDMKSLEWIELWEKFGGFAHEARRHGMFLAQLQEMENDLLDRCPIPQPQQMKV